MPSIKTPCNDCGASPETLHHPGCGLERCPACGRQLIGCQCDIAELERLPWTGEVAGVQECREYGWFARMVPGQGWVSCSPEEPEAVEDLNRLYSEASWDPETHRWIRHS